MCFIAYQVPTSSSPSCSSLGVPCGVYSRLTFFSIDELSPPASTRRSTMPLIVSCHAIASTSRSKPICRTWVLSACFLDHDTVKHQHMLCVFSAMGFQPSFLP